MTDLPVVTGPSEWRHPDAEWILQTRKALDYWSSRCPTSPTSSVLGSGAIAAAEQAFSMLHGGRPALLLPSATYALRVGLQVAGVQPGDEVLCAGIDWPASLAAIRSLGASPVCVVVSPETLTIDPAAAVRARTDKTRALVACHLHGICADIPLLRRAVPGVVIIEDAAQAFRSRLDKRLAGTLGDIAVMSLGPGKHIDAGEGGVLLFADRDTRDAAVAVACHPLRQMLDGVVGSGDDGLVIRPHPMTAVLALYALSKWPSQTAGSQRELRRLLAADKAIRPLGDAERHESSQSHIPVLVPEDSAYPAPAGVRWVQSGAQVLPCISAAERVSASRLLSGVRLAAQEHAG